MRRGALLAVVATVATVGCGVRFTAGEGGEGGSRPIGGGGEGIGGEAGPGSGGGGAGEGGAGGRGHAETPALTVCANTADYGLGGFLMPDNDAKLENPASFGAGAPVEVIFTVVFMLPTEIDEAKLNAQGCDIFQIGLGEAEAGTGVAFNTLSPGQAAALHAWSLVPGHVVLGAQGYASAWGSYGGTPGVQNPMVAPMSGSPLFDGPFDTPTTVVQGGAWQGKYDTLALGQFCPLMEDSLGEVVALVDRPSADVFLADADLISALGGVTAGDAITSANDIVFANLYALLAKLALHSVADPCP